MFRVLDFTPDFLPQDRPRSLMGVSRPEDIEQLYGIPVVAHFGNKA